MICLAFVHLVPLFATLVAAMSASAASIVQQIHSFDSYLASQRAILSVSVGAETMQSMSNSLSSQISSMAIDADGAASITTVINSSSFTGDMKTKLATVVAARFGADASILQTGKKTQTMTSPFVYFTASDWGKFEDTSLLVSTKVHTMVERLMSLGLCNPSETTVKALVATLACVHCPGAEGTMLHSIVVELKSMLSQSRATRHSAGFMATFPETPGELARTLFDIAYPVQGDPPVHKHLTLFATTMSKVPLRTTNKALAQFRSQPASRQNYSLDQIATLLQQIVPTASGSHGIPITYLRGRVPTLQRSGSVTSPSESSGSPSGSKERLAIQDCAQSNQVERAVPTTPLPEPVTPARANQPGVAAAALADADDALDLMERAAANAASGTKGTTPAASGKNAKKKPAAACTSAKTVPVASGKSAKKPPVASDKSAKKPTVASAKSAKKPPVASGHVAKKRPAAAAGFLVLGCAKCRGIHAGCTQCRDPAFTGRRFQR